MLEGKEVCLVPAMRTTVACVRHAMGAQLLKTARRDGVRELELRVSCCCSSFVNVRDHHNLSLVLIAMIRQSVSWTCRPTAESGRQLKFSRKLASALTHIAIGALNVSYTTKSTTEHRTDHTTHTIPYHGTSWRLPTAPTRISAPTCTSLE